MESRNCRSMVKGMLGVSLLEGIADARPSVCSGIMSGNVDGSDLYLPGFASGYIHLRYILAQLEHG